MDRDSQEFRELLTKAKAGDSDAFSNLYKVWYTPVFRFVRLRVKDAEIAEDVTQDVFMRMFKHLDRLELTSVNPLGFLFTSARNAIIDQHKKKKATSLEALELGDIKDESARSPEYESSLRLDSSLLAEALQTLTEEQQTVLQLRLVEELPVREVALKLSKSEEAIRQTQVRALRSLRAAMKDYV